MFLGNNYKQFIDHNKGLATIVYGAQLGKIRCHSEINSSEVVKGEVLYSSPLCSGILFKISCYSLFIVYKGKYKDYTVAIKEFQPNSIAFSWDDFRKEISLLQ